MVYSMAAMVTLAADEALCQKFKDHRYEDPDLERRAVRCLMYMIRCAIAHGPVNPKWECHPRYRQTFEIPPLGIKIDLASLNEQPWQPRHFGGWTKFKLLADRCLELVSQQ